MLEGSCAAGKCSAPQQRVSIHKEKIEEEEAVEGRRLVRRRLEDAKAAENPLWHFISYLIIFDARCCCVLLTDAAKEEEEHSLGLLLMPSSCLFFAAGLHSV